jgi:heme/copper-type cytochrome/quinol oxidase subunit 1
MLNEPMDRLKTILRVGGALFCCMGVMFLPLGYGVSPKRDLNLFNNVADTQFFVTIGAVLMVVGAILLLFSAALPINRSR